MKIHRLSQGNKATYVKNTKAKKQTHKIFPIDIKIEYKTPI